MCAVSHTFTILTSHSLVKRDDALTKSMFVQKIFCLTIKFRGMTKGIGGQEEEKSVQATHSADAVSRKNETYCPKR